MRYCLNEDSLPSKMTVVLSRKLIDEIDLIRDYNEDNEESVCKWRDYIDNMVNYIANRPICL